MALPFIYNVRNLAVRKLSSTLTFLVIAVVVFVLAVLLSFAAGIRASLAATGSPRNVIALAAGATAESTSVIFPEQVTRLYQTPGIARDSTGRLLLSEELCVQTSIPRRTADRALANVAIRGVDDAAFTLHDRVRLVEGEMLQPGQLQLLVGQAARDRYAHLNIGDSVELGRLANRPFKVVGVFESGGSALDSEVWAPRTSLSDAYQRPQISSVLIRIDHSATLSAAIDYITGPSVALSGKTETDYYEDLAEKTREIVKLATVLIGIMAVGATFAVANTMYSAVDGRRREIAMLRTLGFERPAILGTIITESLILCGAGCAVGLAASFFVSGSQKDFLSDSTWTVLAYELKVTPGICAIATITAITVGLAGAIAPALRAAGMNLLEALRKA